MENKNPLKVGITGGIGAGKSTVAKIFSVLGIPVYDADSRAKGLMNTSPVLIEKISELFGVEAYSEGQLNRQVVAKKAFSNKSLLQNLNELVHPEVSSDYKRWMKENKTSAYTLKEAALLYESGSHAELDAIILVSAPEEMRAARVLSRDSHRTEDDIRAIIRNQMPDSEKLGKSDYVIHNDEKQSIVSQSLKIHQALLAQITR
ncbi:MAG: dephospho-CoA kinase [Cyclobacteriaceae bacterium]